MKELSEMMRTRRNELAEVSSEIDKAHRRLSDIEDARRELRNLMKAV
jgi:hypothetical protein